MNHDYAQRRRVAVAVAITVIAAPAAFLLDRDGTNDQASTITVIGSNTVAPSSTTLAPPETDAMGTAPVAFLEGSAPSAADDPPTIAIPRLPQSIEGTASFRRNIASTTCQVKGVPFNATVTVTNLDNSLSVKCVASVGGAEPEDDAVLSADAFLLIADLTDAPVPVQITW